MKTKESLKYYYKEIVLAFICIVLMICEFYIVNRSLNVSGEIKKAKNENLKKGSLDAYLAGSTKLEEEKDKIDIINKAFVDEDSIVGFIKVIDTLKSDGVISNFSFASESTVKDEITGFSVLPFTIEINGNVDVINQTLKTVYSEDYLIRGGLLEILKNNESGAITLKYGGYLYVKENFGKSR